MKEERLVRSLVYLPSYLLFLHKSIDGGVQDVEMKDEDLKVEVKPEEVGESKTAPRFQMDHDGICMRAPPSVVSVKTA